MPTTLSNSILVDALVVVVIGLYVLEDVRNGMLWGLIQLAGLLLSLLVGLMLYPRAADLLVSYVGLPYSIAKPIAFGGIWLLTDMLYSMTVRRWTDLTSRQVASSGWGRVLGAGTGLARGLIVAMLLLGIVAALPLPEPITSAVHDSRLGGPLAARGESVQVALRGVFGDAVQESIGLLTVRPESNERVQLSFKVPSPGIDQTAEQRMLDLVNRERANNGLQPLVMDDTIRQVARAHSDEMFEQGYFAHIDPDGATPFDRMRRGGVSFRVAGENLALGPTVDVAHDGLMNSPGHRANILNPTFRRIGIGVADGGMHGKMFTQNFAD
jgi:uncharacterized protein YkwD/uncharacterized membrane protein required for colicin V production